MTYNFPRDRCCNCFGASGIQVLNQDTRLTRWGFGLGSELTLQLPLPFCEACQATARRRPPTFLKGVLIATLATLCTWAVVGPIALGLDQVWLQDNSGYLALALGVSGTLLWYATRRKAENQSSHYQPVRLIKVKQEFVSGMVASITFRMTSERYGEAFKAANREAIDRGVLRVR